MTTRSFVKRLTAFIRYRRATQDMNAKYEDATQEDIQREDTCIICREEMRPWSVTNPPAPAAAPGAVPPARPATAANERSRPKKLPCGHILHLGCLKSWLERQQVCPTCRRSVTDTSPQAGRPQVNNAHPAIPGAPPAAPGAQNGLVAPPPAAPPGAGRGFRMLNFGPIRVGFGQANLQDMANGLGGQEHGAAGNARVYGLELGFPRRQQHQPQPQSANPPPPTSIQDQLRQIEQQITTEIRNLQLTQQELQLVQLLQVELSRVRLMQDGVTDPLQMPPPQYRQPRPVTPQPQMQRHGARPNTTAIPAGSADLPPGIVIPDGWTLLPLQRLEGAANPSIFNVTQTGTGPASGPAAAPSAPMNSIITSPASGTSNNTLGRIPATNRDDHTRTSFDSPGRSAVRTPPSSMANQSSTENAPLLNTTTPSTIILNGGATPSTETSSNPSVPRNGGLSQMFSGSNGSLTANANPPRDAPPPSQGVTATGQGSLLGTADAGSPIASSDGLEAYQETESRRVEKGKGKAVSIEDVEEESEGS